MLKNNKDKSANALDRIVIESLKNRVLKVKRKDTGSPCIPRIFLEQNNITV